MSFDQSKFTLIALPQSIDDTGLLQLNILFIPRNFSPLENVDTIYNLAGAKPFAQAKPRFVVKVVNKPSDIPGVNPLTEISRELISLEYSTKMEAIYRTLKDAKKGDGTPKYFDIDENRSSGKPGSTDHVAPEPLERNIAVRKYLPLTYRDSFNFTSPRIRNAVTDDSYHCAMRDQTPTVKKPIDHKVSWGKVYAHLLRQPALALASGLLYKTSVQLSAGDFEKGGWLYIDIKDETESDYNLELLDSFKVVPPPNSPFIKRYAAKIPPLKSNEKRTLFTAVTFPVENPGDISAERNFDEIYIEAGRYNHGFATIVHAMQPPSQNLLQESADGLLPQKDLGVRLGWEDEQILIWYLRQMSNEEGKTERTDSPLCVMGYNIDVRLITGGDEDDEEINPWESLNLVSSKGDMLLENDINLGSYNGELPYQVYPSKINTNSEANYWLPMYFANWSNGSIVIPDDDASRIYKNDDDVKHPVKNSNAYLPAKNLTKLIYGKSYQFRVRLSDISGGGPSVKEKSLNLLSESSWAHVNFKRFVAPDTVRIINEKEIIKDNTDDHNFTGGKIILARPIMNYPGVLHTGKYTDPVQRLIDAQKAVLAEQAADSTKGGRAFGIADPDVVSIHIKVEVETLQLDNLASDDGKQNFITIYNTHRNFNNWDESNPDETIDVAVRFVDDPVLDFTNKLAPFSKGADNAFITATSGEIVLPTARNIRITLRAQGLTQENYWGTDAKGFSLESDLGKPKLLTVRKESSNEQKLFTGTNDPQVLQGIYLQPDPVEVKSDVQFKGNFNGTNAKKLPDIVQRLAQQLNVEAKDKSLTAANGERIQFWCSSRIRHNMAPDNSSLTFANKNELQNHWLVCTTLTLNRDWSWDSLDVVSFDIQRKLRFGADVETIAEKKWAKVGDLEFKKTASFQAIQSGDDGTIHREYAKIIFIDVVDGTPINGSFPDISEVQYKIIAKFRDGHSPTVDDPFETKVLQLPVTINPHQSPKLIGAGIALSPYIRNTPYSSSEVRDRYLWLEFDKAPEDPNDELFTRFLAYAPDQLLSNNNPSLLKLEQDLPLNIEPEFVKVVTPFSGVEHSGLHAMQRMIKSKDVDRHFYLLPLRKGLHPDSPELFGFFTQEFRFGHSDRIWSLAQARYGTPLRVAGLQFPAPTLKCLLNRTEKEIAISAPYAQAVFNGQDVTSNPPRTAIWAVLYAQVTQADGKDNRNILLTELELKPENVIADGELLLRIIFEEIRQIENQRIADYKDGLPLEPYNLSELVRDTSAAFQLEKQRMIRHAHGVWNNQQIEQVLDLYGLPSDTPLSVVGVEIFGQITNIKEQINKLDFAETTETVHGDAVSSVQSSTRRIIKNGVLVNSENNYDELVDQMKNGYGIDLPEKKWAKEVYDKIQPNPITSPLSDNLGRYRILRTSPLTEVPFVCCTSEINNSLGLLSLRGSLVADFAIPDNTNIDGWLVDKNTNTVQCTGDIDNDGIDEIILTNPSGLAIVKYIDNTLRIIFSAEVNTAMGDWIYDDINNGGRDWGYKIAKFNGEQNELLLISKQGIATLRFKDGNLSATKILKNDELHASWKVNTSDHFVGISKLFNETETNIVFENSVDMHLVSLKNPDQTFTLRTGIRYGQWLFNRGDNTIQCFGDFDGDGVDELFISSPWGIGILKWVDGIVTSIAMQVNGSDINGYVVDNKNIFSSPGNYLGKKSQEIIVHDNNKLLAVLALDKGVFIGINLPAKNLIMGDLAGEFVAKMDKDQKSDLLFKNGNALWVANLDETAGVEIQNIVQMNVDINGWKLQNNDMFVAAGNFLNHPNEQQLLVVAQV